jgi:hypothetical protein
MKRAPQAKSQAAILVREMQAAGIEVKHQQALEFVAKMSGFRDWNAMSGASTPVSMPPDAPTGTARPNESAILEKLIRLATDVCQESSPDVDDSQSSAICQLDTFVRSLDKPAYSNNPLINFDPKRQIALIWSVDDVLEFRSDLTQDEAFEVLQKVKQKHDASVGVSYETVEGWADWIFAKRTLPCSVSFTDSC